MSEPRGIVVVGTPRSGTTLVRRILDAHPNIACPPETYLFGAAARFLHAETFAAGLPIGVESGLSYAGVEDGVVLERLRELVFSFLGEHARAQGKPRWAEKTAFDAFHLETIDRVFGDHVQYICIVRHGLDVAVSLQDLVHKTGGYVEELHRYVQADAQPLRAMARAWVDTSTMVADLAGRRGAAIIRYEDLVADPATAVAAMLESVGETLPDGLLETALSRSDSVGFGDWKTFGRSQVDRASVERWKGLPAATILELSRVCNPLLSRLGYDEVPQNPQAVEDARRRYELGLLANRLRRES